MARVARVARSRARAVLAAALALATVAGCGDEEESGVPVACMSTSDAVVRALAAAPDPVTVRGVPISECFTKTSDSGDLQAVGIAMTEAVAELASEARARPRGDATLELGYLVAAVRRGSQRTQGIHDELLRRVELELHGVDTGSRAFEAGERAGLETG